MWEALAVAEEAQNCAERIHAAINLVDCLDFCEEDNFFAEYLFGGAFVIVCVDDGLGCEGHWDEVGSSPRGPVGCGFIKEDEGGFAKLPLSHEGDLEISEVA